MNNRDHNHNASSSDPIVHEITNFRTIFLLCVCAHWFLSIGTVFFNSVLLRALRLCSGLTRNVKFLLCNCILCSLGYALAMLIKSSWHLAVDWLLSESNTEIVASVVLQAAVIQATRTECATRDFLLNLFAGGLAYTQLAVAIEQLHGNRRVIKGQVGESLKRAVALAVAMWILLLLLMVDHVYGAVTAQNQAMDSHWCTFTGSAGRIYFWIVIPLTCIQVFGTLLVLEFVRRSNAKIHEAFKKPGVSQSLEIRAALKHTTNTTEGLKWCIRLHVVLFLESLVYSLIKAPLLQGHQELNNISSAVQQMPTNQVAPIAQAADTAAELYMHNLGQQWHQGWKNRVNKADKSV